MEVIGLLIRKYEDAHVPELEEGCIVDTYKLSPSFAPSSLAHSIRLFNWVSAGRMALRIADRSASSVLLK